MSLNESEALGRTVSEALWTTLGENERLGLKVDDTLFDIRLDAETLRLTEKSALERKVLVALSIWLTVNGALKAEPIVEDEDPLVDSDWLCKDSKDDTPRLTECKSLERTLVEEDTLRLTDWDWLRDLLLDDRAL